MAKEKSSVGAARGVKGLSASEGRGTSSFAAQDRAGQLQMFRSLADHSQEFIGMCDLEFKPFYVNEAGWRLVGLGSMEEACGVKVQDYFFPGDQRFINEEFFPKVLREGAAEVEIRFRHFKTGAALWMIYNVFQVRDEAGRVSGYATVSRNITERKRAEERVQADLGALRRMHDLSGRLLAAGGLEALLQEVMDAAVAMMGAERGTLQLLEGESLRIVAHHGHERAFLDFFAAAENRASVCGEASRRGGRVVVPDVEKSALFAGTPSLEVLRRAGVRAVQSTPLMSRAGMLIGILTTQWGRPYEPDKHDLWRLDLLVRQAADLIQKERAEEALERERNILKVVMDGAGNAHLVYLDRDFNFVRVNQTYARSCGSTPEQMIGKNHFALYPHAENEAIFARVRDSGETVEFHDKPFVFPDQPERGVTYSNWTLTPVKGEADQVVGLAFSLFETTARKRAEETLRRDERRQGYLLKLSDALRGVAAQDRSISWLAKSTDFLDCRSQTRSPPVGKE